MRRIDVQAFANSFLFIVVALNQGFSGDIVNPSDFGRIEMDVIGAPAGHMHPTPAHALDDGFKGHIDFEHVVEVDACQLHRVGLRNGAGKAVKQKTIGAIGLCNAFFDQANDDVITHQTARVHDFFGRQSHGSACFDGSTKHVARGNLGNTKLFANESGLGAFACTRCA